MTVARTARSSRTPREHPAAGEKSARSRENDLRERERLLADLPGKLRRASMRPDDAHALQGVSLCYSGLARLDARLPSGATARWLEKDLAVRERIADLEPGDDLAAAQLASGLWRLARAVERADPRRARALLVKALEIRDRLADEAPGDAHRAEMVALTSSGLARIDGRADPARGRTWLVRAEAIRARIAENEPDNVEALHDLAFSRLALARMEEKLSCSAAARAHERWLSTIERCLELRPDDDAISFDRALAAVDFAEALAVDGNPDAGDATRRALDFWRSLARSRPDDPFVHVGLAWACFALESLLHRAGRSRDKGAIAREHARAVHKAEQLGASGAWFDLLRARSLSSRGRAADALAAIESAVAQGFDDTDVLLQAAEFRVLRAHPRFRTAFQRAAGGATRPAD